MIRFERFAAVSELFNDERANGCHLGKLFLALQDRPAGSYRSTTYLPDDFYLDLETAKESIEPRRARASNWIIDELPTLVIRGSSAALLVSEINTGVPGEILPRYLPPLERFLAHSEAPPALTLLQFGEHFAPAKLKNEETVLRFLLRPPPPPADLPFCKHSSAPPREGTRKPMGWYATSRDPQWLHAVVELVAKVNTALQSS